MKKKMFIVLAAVILCCIYPVLYKINSDGKIIEKLEDLNGRKVGVQTATLYEDVFLKKVPGAEIVFFDDFSTMILATKQGKIDAYLTEGDILKEELKYNPDLRPLVEPVSSIDVGIVIGNNSRQDILYQQMEEFIAAYNVNGLKDKLVEQWLDNFDSETAKADKSGITGENGTLTVAMEAGYIPYSYISDGELQGFHVDLIYHFCREYGYKPVFMSMTYNSVVPAVMSGKCDMGTGFVLSMERTEGNVFTSPYKSYEVYAVVSDKSEKGKSVSSMLTDGFRKTFIVENRWKMFAEGIGITLLIAIISVFLGTLLGLGIYMICFSNSPKVGKIMDGLSWIIHGLPTVVLLMVIYYVMFSNFQISGIMVSIIGFSIIFTFSMYNMIKSGVLAVGTGQYEAARAQGFSNMRTFLKVIFPQACRFFLPVYKNEIVTLLKETSIVGYIAVMDLTKMSDLVRSRTFDAFFPLVTSSLIYLFLILIVTSVVNRLGFVFRTEKRDARKALRGIRL